MDGLTIVQVEFSVLGVMRCGYWFLGGTLGEVLKSCNISISGVWRVMGIQNQAPYGWNSHEMTYNLINLQ